jgi:hypothetical protein
MSTETLTEPAGGEALSGDELALVVGTGGQLGEGSGGSPGLTGGPDTLTAA